MLLQHNLCKCNDIKLSNNKSNSNSSYYLKCTDNCLQQQSDKLRARDCVCQSPAKSRDCDNCTRTDLKSMKDATTLTSSSPNRSSVKSPSKNLTSPKVHKNVELSPKMSGKGRGEGYSSKKRHSGESSPKKKNSESRATEDYSPKYKNAGDLSPKIRHPDEISYKLRHSGELSPKYHNAGELSPKILNSEEFSYKVNRSSDELSPKYSPKIQRPVELSPKFKKSGELSPKYQKSGEYSPKYQKTSDLSPKYHKTFDFPQEKVPKTVEKELKIDDSLNPINPHSDQLLSPMKVKVLEKSNSLGESKPAKQLRTTKSLSPRPPMKHQHSIMISDENGMVLVPDPDEPTQDFDDVFNKKRKNSEGTGLQISSDNSSPVLSDSGVGSLRLDDRHMNNRSTSCLVYVPSDPWTKMTEDLVESGTTKKDSKKTKKALEAKSLSKPSLTSDDPWVWRTDDDDYTDKKKGGANKKAASYKQSRSMLAKLEENNMKLCQQMKFSTNNMSMPGPAPQTVPSSSLGRPKMQRSKSPGRSIDDHIEPTPISTSNKYKEKKRPAKLNPIPVTSSQYNQPNNPTSPMSLSPKTLSLSPTLGYRSVPDTNFGSTKKTSSPYLNISNPNLMQPRHSFSSLNRKDDELQLNIRRLSEQMKYTNYFSSATSSSTLPGPASMPLGTQQEIAGDQKLTQSKEKDQPHDKKLIISDSLLETTC